MITAPIEVATERQRLQRETKLRALRGIILAGLTLAQDLELEPVIDALLAAQVAVVRAADTEGL